MAEVVFKLDDKEVMRRIDQMQVSLKSYKQPLEAAGSDLMGYFSTEPFKTQGKALGEAWQPHAPSTILARQMRRGYYANAPVETNKILVWTGRMRAGFKKEAQNLKLRIFNTNENFKWNQPNRPMLGITDSVVRTVMQHLTDYINLTIK